MGASGKQPAPRRPWTPASERTYARHAIARAPISTRPTLRAFARWLERERGLGLGTIVVRVSSARSFVAAVTSGGAISCQEACDALTEDGVERFVIAYGKDHGIAARRSMGAVVRQFLTFAAHQGWRSQDLAAAVPGVRGYRLSGVPRGVSDAHLAALMGSLDGTSARDQAILLLLATYGVRRAQISMLRLTEVDWRARMITFAAHKGGKPVQHVLTPVVADAVARYLRDERPVHRGAHVFLRGTPPYLRLSPMAITMVVRQMMERAGLVPRGPHALRHAFATRLLRHGQSLKVIADLLGHRSLEAVAVYAKVDFARLSEVASEWPEVQP